VTTEHQFHDPLSGQTVTLVIGQDRESTGVRHDCAALAQVFPELDCASCSSCHWQARISGAWFMDVWEQAHETAEEGAARLLREEVEEHVSDIMFTGSESPDPDCVLCKHGIEIGVWARYGVDDPFAPEDAQ
jgi:hypothetical protein